MANDMATKSEVERLGMLEQKVGDGFKNIDRRFDEVIKRLDDNDTKYAAKWVQTIVGGLIFVILMGFIGVVVAFFIRDPSANNPTTSTTTTVNNPAGSTSTTSTKDGTPTASSTATAHSDAAKPADSQTDNGGVTVTVPKAQSITPIP